MQIEKPIKSFYFNRFQVFITADDQYLFKDMLLPQTKLLDKRQFDKLSGIELDRAFLQRGFVHSAISALTDQVQARARHGEDFLFWQFPCRTEGRAWECHRDWEHIQQDADTSNLYLGLPWATWIDCQRKKAWGNFGEIAIMQQLQLLATYLAGLRNVLAAHGITLRLHTVCQHIYWRDMIATWNRLGLTDVWLSHCPASSAGLAELGFLPHPWALFAVNVQDPERNVGLSLGKDPASKSVTASFVGAYAPGYLSDVRLQLRQLADTPGFVIKVNDKWHFEDVVYRHQMAHADLASNYVIDDSVAHYNRLLSDSVFSLCPSGTGPNTLRLWESLAVGAIPVLLGPAAAMPQGGSLGPIDWEAIVLRIADEQIADLPRILGAMPLPQIRQRQMLAMQAFAQVAHQRCF